MLFDRTLLKHGIWFILACHIEQYPFDRYAINGLITGLKLPTRPCPFRLCYSVHPDDGRNEVVRNIN